MQPLLHVKSDRGNSEINSERKLPTSFSSNLMTTYMVMHYFFYESDTIVVEDNNDVFIHLESGISSPLLCHCQYLFHKCLISSAIITLMYEENKTMSLIAW